MAELLQRYLDRIAAEAWVAAVHHDPAQDPWSWYVRLTGEERDFVAVWLRVGERTLRFESYLMPPPEENVEQLYLYLLKVNHGLVGAKYGIGGKDELGVFLSGHLPVEHVDEAGLDAAIGLCWETIEANFATAMGIGYASTFRPRRRGAALHPLSTRGRATGDTDSPPGSR